MRPFTKDPVSVLNYKFDWSKWLESDGDTLSSTTITADSGITVDKQSLASTSVTVWLSGGTVGKRYTIDCAITTAAGLKSSRKMSVLIVDR